MEPTTQQERDFLAEIMPAKLLRDAIWWIDMRLSPEEVFGEESLIQWAEQNGYVLKED